MKKVLVLTLVLAMASLASAVVTTTSQGYYFEMEITTPSVALTAATGDIVSVEIFAGTSGVSEMLDTVLNVSEVASISALSVTAGNPWSFLNVSNGMTASGSGYNVNVDGTLTAAITAGNSIYSFNFIAGPVGTVTVDATGGSWHGFPAAAGADDAWYSSGALYGLPYAQVTVIPEPATIVLLSLGGLLLRRKK